MRAPGWVVLASCGIATISVASHVLADPAPKAAAPAEIDSKPFRDRVLMFQDAQGGTYAVLRDSSPRVFYGAGKELHEQVIVGSSANGDQWDISTWTPRLPDFQRGAIQRLEDGTFRRWCNQLDDAGITPVTGEKATKLLASVKLLPPFDRRAYLLARDDAGVYYYVDKLRGAGQGYRIYVGKKGAMKLLPLTDVAVDSGGAVFSTKSGDLRLVASKDNDADKLSTSERRKAKWVHGEKAEELLYLDLETNEQLIYKDLGVYAFLGTLCDNV